MRRLLRATLLLTFSSVLAGLGNFAFNILVARQGGAVAYGAVAPLLAVAAVATVLMTATTFAVARMVVATDIGPRAALRRSVRALVPWLALTLALLALAQPLAAYLHLGGPGLVIYALLFGAAGIAAGSPLGVLLGKRRYGLIALVTVAMPVSRVVALEGLQLALPVTDAALLSSLLAGVVTVAAGCMAVLRLPVAAGEAADRSTESIAQETITGSLLAGALWVMWAIPVAIARHVLPPAAAGDFAGVQLIASGVIYLSSPVVTAFYPHIARDVSGRSARQGFVATVSVAGAAALGLVVVGPALTPRLYGSGFSTPSLLFVGLGLSATAIATATYTLWAGRAARRFTGIAAVAVVVSLVAELALAPRFGGLVVPLALLPAVAAGFALIAVTVAVLVHHQARHIDVAARSSACLACLALRP